MSQLAQASILYYSKILITFYSLKKPYIYISHSKAVNQI